MDSLTHLDLCSGIGGFHLAAEWAGFRTVGFSEIEPYCCKLLAEKWPEIKNYGDLRTADFSDLGHPTVLSAGVPCQPASLAGKRRGKEDDRWLWEAVLDVVGSVKPTWAIFENPDGILSVEAFAPILLRLDDLGYEVRGFHVPANAVGANHRRFRVFIVAYSHCSRLSGAEYQTIQGAGRREKGRAASELLRPESDASLLRKVHGVRNRRDRIKALGNSVCPQQAYPFFEAIAQIEV